MLALLVLATWSAPIGIPPPPFGVMETAGARTHYVDSAHPAASDTGNPNGSPEFPRRTIPLDLPAGSVVEVFAAAPTGPSGEVLVNGTGTEALPIFIVGGGFTPTALIGHYGPASRIVLDGLSLSRVQIAAPAARVAVRYCDVGHSDGVGVTLASWNGGDVHTVVLRNNFVHDSGDWYAPDDPDGHGIQVGARCSSVWILDNELTRNSGDGVQITGDMASTHHIYVGRNVAHHNKQSGLWAKQCSDVIFSENSAYAHEPIGAQPTAWGAGMGCQYAPERVWFLFNSVHDCCFGVQATSGDGGTGSELFLVGNRFKNIRHSAAWPYKPSSPWASAAIQIVAPPTVWLIDNAITECDAGVNVVSGSPRIDGQALKAHVYERFAHLYGRDLP